MSEFLWWITYLCWKENERLKKIVADLQLDKLILKESLDYLKPKA